MNPRQYVIWAVIFFSSFVTGCCSGYPAFVKFAPDSRYLVYQDSRYPRTYVYDLKDGRKYIYTGDVACVTPQMDRFVLRPRKTDNPMSCSVVRLGSDEPCVEKLPPLPTGKLYPVVAIRFGPAQDQLSAAVYPNSYAEGPSAWYVLRIGQEKWTQKEIPKAMIGKKPYLWFPPVGIRDTGHVYSPIHEPGIVPETDKWGLDVENALTKDSKLYHKMLSPDGKYVVTIHDPDDLWRRVWVTDISTRRRTILLDKNDLVSEIALGIAMIPGGILLVLFGPNI